MVIKVKEFILKIKQLISEIKLMKIEEVAVLISCILLLFGGFLFDCYKCFSWFINCSDKQLIMTTIAQAHASMATLGMALLSIITSRFGHKVDGIEITHFLANRYRQIFKQKNILTMLVFSVVFSLVMVVCGNIGLVFCSFLSSIILLCFELNDIWLMFKKDEEISLIIKEYIKKEFLINDDFAINYLRVPVDTDINSWSDIDSERYKNNVIELWSIVLKTIDDKDKFDKYSSYYAMSVKGFIERGNSSQKAFALDYLLELYRVYNSDKRKFAINIFADVSYSLYQILPDLNDKALKVALIYLPKVVFNASYNAENNKDGQ